MQHALLPSVPKKLLGIASSINNDASIPLRVPEATTGFLHRLGKQCDHSTKPLGRFLLLVPTSQLVDQIIHTVLPADFNAIRDELERLQYEKEHAVANQDWEHAVVLRDRADPLKDRLRQLCRDALEVKPDHVLLAIRNLGFECPITVAE
ncbi:MAG: hypothetical protein WD278_00745 [Pirellulales bacterium]